MIWKYSQGQILRFGINWWSDRCGLGAVFYFPMWTGLSSYWDWSSRQMLFGFRFNTAWFGFDFQKIKFDVAVDLAKRIKRFLKYKTLIWGLLHSISIIYGMGHKSIGKQNRLYSMKDLKEKECQG